VLIISTPDFFWMTPGSIKHMPGIWLYTVNGPFFLANLRRINSPLWSMLLAVGFG
jgi:hypothetical protein